MKQRINVFTIEHLEECLEDTIFDKDKMAQSLSVIDRFVLDKKVRKTDTVTTVSFTIFLDGVSDRSIDIINRLKIAVKDVSSKVDVDILQEE